MASVKKSLESDNGSLKRMVKKKIQQKHRKEKEKEKTIERMLNEPVGGTREKCRHHVL